MFMNPLKQILKWTIIFLLSFTTFNFFISGKIEASIEIEVPSDVVYEKVADLQTWSTWWKKDSIMITAFSGAKIGVGAKMSWTGMDDWGSLEIVKTNYGKNLKTELIFDGLPLSHNVWNFEETDRGTRVTLSFQDELPFYVHFMQLFISAELEAVLVGLKNSFEYYKH